MREESLARRVETIVTAFDFSRPFAIYLREYFRKNPQMGARDRRMARTWCFNYLRIGRASIDLTFRERLKIGCFLCSNQTDSYLDYLFNDSPLPVESLDKLIEDKFELVKSLYPDFDEQDIFPMREHLSDEIQLEAWVRSFLKKPKVWIRVRPAHLDDVKKELNKLEIKFATSKDPVTLSFSPEVQLEKTESYQNGLFEIQDLSSQLTGKYFTPSDHEKWWDACAGSGGKSLMLKEMAKDVFIIATDVRIKMLMNYSDRMKKAGHFGFDTVEYDFDPPNKKRNLNLPQFDGIIADVPCTGSGTWSRSPEWTLNDHAEKLLDFYIPLQRKVVSQCVEFLKVGKPLIYITCSAFKEENEENIRYFESAFPLVTDKFEYLKGFSSGADTLFVARFIRK